MRIIVDTENNAEEWWDAARPIIEAGNAPRGAGVLLALGNTALTEQEWATLRKLAAALPGWDTGPDYARTPIRAS